MNGSGNGRVETILVVEDAEPIRKMVCSMLSFSGYNCLEAADGKEALRIVKTSPNAVDLILTDILMPHMNGTDLAREVSSLRPDLPVIFMSGYSDDPVVRTLEGSPALFLPKPFTATALTDKIRTVLDRRYAPRPDGARTRSAQ